MEFNGIRLRREVAQHAMLHRAFLRRQVAVAIALQPLVDAQLVITVRLEALRA